MRRSKCAEVFDAGVGAVINGVLDSVGKEVGAVEPSAFSRQPSVKARRASSYNRQLPTLRSAKILNAAGVRGAAVPTQPWTGEAPVPTQADLYDHYGSLWPDGDQVLEADWWVCASLVVAHVGVVLSS